MQEAGRDGRRGQQSDEGPDLARAASRLLRRTQPLHAEITVFEIAVTAVHGRMFIFPIRAAGRKTHAFDVAAAPARGKANAYTARRGRATAASLLARVRDKA